MIRIMLGCLAAMLLVVGCHSHGKDDDCCKDMKTSSAAKAGCCDDMKHASRSGPVDMSKVDVCSMCEGVQHLTADGKCDKCGMAVKDVCPMCPGVQVKLADGGCSGCGCMAQ